MPEPNKTKEYKQGRQARLDRVDEYQYPYGDAKRKGLWKAGWHDTDKEMNKRMGC